jgi:hypothetical protein
MLGVVCIHFGYHISNLFITDPTPTVVKNTTDMTIERYLYNTPSIFNSNNNNNNNDKNDQKKKIDVNHSCSKCNSRSLSF